jgi:hypothetical protein
MTNRRRGCQGGSDSAALAGLRPGCGRVCPRPGFSIVAPRRRSLSRPWRTPVARCGETPSAPASDLRPNRQVTTAPCDQARFGCRTNPALRVAPPWGDQSAIPRPAEISQPCRSVDAPSSSASTAGLLRPTQGRRCTRRLAAPRERHRSCRMRAPAVELHLPESLSRPRASRVGDRDGESGTTAATRCPLAEVRFWRGTEQVDRHRSLGFPARAADSRHCRSRSAELPFHHLSVEQRLEGPCVAVNHPDPARCPHLVE